MWGGKSPQRVVAVLTCADFVVEKDSVIEVELWDVNEEGKQRVSPSQMMAILTTKPSCLIHPKFSHKTPTSEPTKSWKFQIRPLVVGKHILTLSNGSVPLLRFPLECLEQSHANCIMKTVCKSELAIVATLSIVDSCDIGSGVSLFLSLTSLVTLEKVPACEAVGLLEVHLLPSRRHHDVTLLPDETGVYSFQPHHSGTYVISILYRHSHLFSVPLTVKMPHNHPLRGTLSRVHLGTKKGKKSSRKKVKREHAKERGKGAEREEGLRRASRAERGGEEEEETASPSGLRRFRSSSFDSAHSPAGSSRGRWRRRRQEKRKTFDGKLVSTKGESSASQRSPSSEEKEKVGARNGSGSGEGGSSPPGSHGAHYRFVTS